jgi:hypothetical protein
MVAMNCRRRSVALATAVVGVVVLVVAGFVGKGWIEERYYIQNLSSTDEAVRLRAVDALADAKSVRAVPHLIRLLSRERREKVSHWAYGGMIIACGPGGSSYTPTPQEEAAEFMPIVYALQDGRDAAPSRRNDARSGGTVDSENGWRAWDVDNRGSRALHAVV